MTLIISDILIRKDLPSNFVLPGMIKPAYIFSVLSILFLVLSFSIYLSPQGENHKQGLRDAAQGRLVWQKYNCQSCHQLYGLGGYLGPDLTNIISQSGKGEVYVRAMLKSGVSQMPVFNLSKEEEEQLLSFLKQTDGSGKADPRTFSINPYGMIEQQ